jgi:hypothetical protein
MEKNQTARVLFREYRRLADNDVDTYNRLKTAYPGRSFPKAAARVWRSSALAQLWGETATWLNGGVIDYISEWRQGGSV